MKIRAILCNGKTADRIEVGFSLSNRPKISENTPGTKQVAIKEIYVS